ncbi:hypothetical protein AGMMS49532_05130 [Endomicrobiia bacterium]|nr:hypothetical protein AGMMS49532_05130 [Endomicrobiia bacterium]
MKLKMFMLALSASLLIFLLIFSYKDIRGNNRAVRYFNDGNFEAASESFNKELEKLPGSYSIFNNAAGAEYKLNKFDEAQTKYNAVLDFSDADQEEKFIALYGLGNTEYGKNDFRKAASLYKKALRLKPGDKDAKYNLEVALLKLNEKDSCQNNNDNSSKQNSRQKGRNNKQNEQNIGNRQQSKEERDLKRHMEQNDKAQKENEKKRQSLGRQVSVVRDEIQKRQNVQKGLEEEKLRLDKQKLEISNKIEALKKTGVTKNKFSKRKNESQGDNPLDDKSEKEKLEMQPVGEKEDKKDMPAAIFLNYYDEAERKAYKLRNKNKKSALNQPQEDW